MKKTYKIFIILAFSLLILTTNIYASSVVMDLESNNINNNINQNADNLNTNPDNLITSNTFNENNVNSFNEFSQNNIIDNTTENNSSSSNVQTSNPVVTTTSSNDNNFLTVENILSISIIVIGVLLIFLSIAILIRCKN